MNIPKEYIKMSSKAVEIQKLWKPTLGDVYTSYKWNEIDVVQWNYEDNEIECLSGIAPHIWLPHQNQLQEMIDNKNCYKCLNLFILWYQNDETILADSIEQLWLAFVMKEKYNKIWNGSEWELLEDKQGEQ